MSKIIGIDLGSTLSEVAIMEGGKPTILVNEEGHRTTPSVISYVNGERKVGDAAKRQAVMHPENTVVLIKRFMGGTYDEIKDNISHVQYPVVNVNGYPIVRIDGKDYTPEQLSAEILMKMKTIAENYLGEKVTDAVITVPAYFGDAQRNATKKAGEIAGLNVRRIVAEPTAAILASNIDMVKGGKYMVVDYGGSTLDFSIADIADNVVEILASDGDVYCGGSDIDKLLADYVINDFKEKEGVDVSHDSMAMQRIMEAVETAKINLSNVSTTDINLPYIAVDSNRNPKNLVMTITKAKFEQIIDSEIQKVINHGKKALADAKLTDAQLDGILLVGGSTRIPKVQEELKKAFHKDKLLNNVNVDEAVALGAAVQGSIIAGEKTDVLLLDVTPLSLGIDTMNGLMATIIEANTTIPAKKSQVFSTAVDNQTAVTIVVAQGNRPKTSDNKQIGVFNLEGIPMAPRGVPQIEVTFDIDANGILNVSAKDKGTGKEQSIRIESKSSISDADIERMKKEAEEHAADDAKEKESLNKLNMLDSMIFQTEKSMEEFKDKITDEERESMKSVLEEGKRVVKDKDSANYDSATKNITDKWTPIITKIYASTQQNGSNGQNPFGGANGQNPFSGGQNPFSAQ